MYQLQILNMHTIPETADYICMHVICTADLCTYVYIYICLSLYKLIVSCLQNVI